MPREYFPSRFHLDNRTRYFLWSSEDLGDDIDHDEVWTRDGIAPTFATLAQVETFARDELGVSPIDEGEPPIHDLTSVARWLRLKKSHRARQVDAGECLAAWNIFADLARSLNVPFSGSDEAHKPIYTKLFFGDFCWFKIADSRRMYHWSGADIKKLHTVLDEGLKLWRRHVR